MTFLVNIDPGGAVGGRFIRIFDANGASDARLIFDNDKSMAIGSFDSTMPSSSWNDTEIKRREINCPHWEYVCRTHQTCQFCEVMEHVPSTTDHLWSNALPFRNHCRQDLAVRRALQYRNHWLPILLWFGWELSKLCFSVDMLTAARLSVRQRTSACSAVVVVMVAAAAADAQTGTEMDRIVPSDRSFSAEKLSCFVPMTGRRSVGSGPTWHASIVDGYR